MFSFANTVLIVSLLLPALPAVSVQNMDGAVSVRESCSFTGLTVFVEKGLATLAQPLERTSPAAITSHPRAEMFATHNSQRRWSEPLIRSFAIVESAGRAFDSSVLDLRTQMDSYAIDAPIVESEWFRIPLRLDCGEPESRLVQEFSNLHFRTDWSSHEHVRGHWVRKLFKTIL